jgi:hypothetical protein
VISAASSIFPPFTTTTAPFFSTPFLLLLLLSCVKSKTCVNNAYVGGGTRVVLFEFVSKKDAFFTPRKLPVSLEQQAGTRRPHSFTPPRRAGCA